jgi:phosphoheptose isomerase
VKQEQEDWTFFTTVDQLQSYEDVTKSLSKKKRRKHLLLGNGFSVAYDAKIFSYNALSKYIENSSDYKLKRLFNVAKTKNFEEIMQQLKLFAEFAEVFAADKSFLAEICDTAKKLETSLIKAIQEMHPEHVFKIPDEKVDSCSAFLNEYLQNNGYVFSANYDLLLYWVLMRKQDKTAGDGFGRDVEKDTDEFIPENEIEWSELRWDRNQNQQKIFYRHGALFLFDTGTEIVKEEYDGTFLLEKIKERIRRNEYPVFVMSGNAKDKLRRIKHNRYLSFCYDTLSSLQECSLITYGFSFSDNDTHIIDAINKAAKQSISGRLRSIYIGVFSDDDLQHIKDIRDKFKIIKVNVFNAKTVNAWGSIGKNSW